MRCPTCGASNSHEARFCASCGLPLDSQGELRPPEEATVGLAPRDMTGLIVETFAVYRRNFWPFFLIFLAPQVPGIIFSVLPGRDSWAVVAIFLAMFFVLYLLAAGASVCAVAQQYLQSTIDPGYCYRRAWYRVVSLGVSNVVFTLALIGAISGILLFFKGASLGASDMGFALTLFGAILTVVGIPLFFYILVAWFFFAECIMLDRAGPMAALWRSRDLVRGSYWRIFGIGLVYTLMLVVMFVLTLRVSSDFAIFSAFLAAVAVGVLTAMAGPVLSIGRTLVYLDLRVKKEDYTMDDLARELGA